VPVIVTFPEAKIMTGVFAAFGVNVTVTPAGTFTVVKLKTPLGGRATVVLVAGAKAPSAPVLPLSKGADITERGVISIPNKTTAAQIRLRKVLRAFNFVCLMFFVIAITSLLFSL
jgi:hypothetical protein